MNTKEILKLVLLFTAIFFLEGLLVQLLGLQTLFSQNPILAFVGPGAVGAVIYVGIDKYFLKMRRSK